MLGYSKCVNVAIVITKCPMFSVCSKTLLVSYVSSILLQKQIGSHPASENGIWIRSRTSQDQ